ncbi:MAG TPA: hypothetical protein VG478_05000 [Acidimicrobiales bacterium]|jgi:hypothetical protein|nr:hypothetical protein [Acidimicrobiales bacterium]
MPAYVITYQGPPTLAVRAATLLADSTGVELTSSDPPERSDDPEHVTLSLTVQGSDDAVTAAIEDVGSLLSPYATLEVSAI